MSDVLSRPLGIVSSPSVKEEVVDILTSGKTLNADHFANLNERISRGSLCAALASLTGLPGGSGTGFLMTALSVSAEGSTFSLSGEDGWMSGVCLPRAASGGVREEAAGAIAMLDSEGIINGVPFENGLLTTYYVALSCATLPSEAEQNPRSGAFEYTKEKTVLGVKVIPEAVSDSGDGLTLTLPGDAPLGTASLAGRSAVIYKLSDPQGETGTAIRTATVTWDGSRNTVSTTYLGQSTPDMDPGDYAVVLLGPLCSNDPTLFEVSGVIPVGTLVGGVQPTPSTSEQVVLPTLSKVFRDVLRLSPAVERDSGRTAYKLQVQASPGEEDVDQITVKDREGNVRFSVNEEGVVVINGATFSLVDGKLSLGEVNLKVLSLLFEGTIEGVHGLSGAWMDGLDVGARRFIAGTWGDPGGLYTYDPPLPFSLPLTPACGGWVVDGPPSNYLLYAGIGYVYPVAAAPLGIRRPIAFETISRIEGTTSESESVRELQSLAFKAMVEADSSITVTVKKQHRDQSPSDPEVTVGTVVVSPQPGAWQDIEVPLNEMYSPDFNYGIEILMSPDADGSDTRIASMWLKYIKYAIE